MSAAASALERQRWICASASGSTGSPNTGTSPITCIGPHDTASEPPPPERFDMPIRRLAGCAAMRVALQGLALGGSVFATAYVAQRLIAPYSGLSLALYCGIAFSTLLGFAVGCAPGARTGSAERSGPLAARALLLAAILTLLISQ